MKTVLRRIGLLAIAGTMVLASCSKKENIEDLKASDDQELDNNYLQPNGTITATLSGKKKDITNMSSDSYKFEDKVFSYASDNFGEESVSMSTQKVSRSGYLTGNYDYTVKSFNISMGATSGEDFDNDSNDDYISIRFNIYEGTLPEYMELGNSSSYRTGEPQEIYVSYAVYYAPNEDSKIDRVGVQGSISPKESSNLTTYTKVERVTITSFEFDENTGAISFEFKGNDSDDDNNQESVEGKVKTTIMVNDLLEQDKDINSVGTGTGTGSYTDVEVYYDGGYYYFNTYGSQVSLSYVSSGVYKDSYGKYFTDSDGYTDLSSGSGSTPSYYTVKTIYSDSYGDYILDSYGDTVYVYASSEYPGYYYDNYDNYYYSYGY